MTLAGIIVAAVLLLGIVVLAVGVYLDKRNDGRTHDWELWT